jgi:hypothetical protein
MSARPLAALLVLGALAAPVGAERAIEIAGYLGHYDAATVPLWPERLQLLLGGVRREGPLVADAKRRAAAAGNPARFVFYLSLSSLDGGCKCFDAELLERLRREHPEFLLRDARGEPISTFLDRIGPDRQLALDVGNPAYVEAWTDAALAQAARFGWDGVFADNVIRRFGAGWSAAPVNPRTHRPYTQPEYQTDMLAALRLLRRRFDARRLIVIGNHGGAWRSFEEEPVLRDQVVALHGVQIEDFAYTWRGEPQPEADWLRQLRYLDFANRAGVLTYAHGVGGAFMEPARREYVLASYLLTRRGRSVVGDLNAAKTWWPALATDVGTASGDFYCLDPQRDFARGEPCPTAGRVLGRDFTRARVVVNPGETARTVPLGAAFAGLDGAAVTDPLPLPAHSGRVLVRPHTASRTSSGRSGR